MKHVFPDQFKEWDGKENYLIHAILISPGPNFIVQLTGKHILS